MGTRTVGPLTAAEVDGLRVAEYAYPEVGATATEPPDGYHHLRRERVIGHGETLFRARGSDVLRWQIQLRSGFTVNASANVVVEGASALLGIGVGRVRLKAPVRIVYVVDEAHRQGFAYGTLPGHPESGEELFCVEHRPDDSVVLVIAAFSRPQTPLARVAGPLGRVGQQLITARYLRSLRER
ncbi:DUF1990 family protein [Williamsia soli]|uniref:DUF1990 family protein n=1 Tax=Williamsia soli TaxID=364929 RepID=UPI001A9FBCD4|nr:DUF1990 domain-containing protein [Williamsia soli]